MLSTQALRNRRRLHREGFERLKINSKSRALQLLHMMPRGTSSPSHGDGDMKGSAPWDVRCHPNSSSVTFDDELADEQSHPHAGRLGRVEWVENTSNIFRAYAWSRVSYGDGDVGRPVHRSADRHFARTLCALSQCLDGVDNQIQNHLLQLNPISFDERQSLCKLRMHRDAVLHRLAARKLNHLVDRPIELRTFHT